MKTEFSYVVLAIDGGCSRLVDGRTEPCRLADAFANGWRPVRETAIAPGSVLILLEREPEGSFGFGFTTP